MKVSIASVFLVLGAVMICLLSDRSSIGISGGYGVPVYSALSRASILTVPLFVASCMSAFFFRVGNLWNRPGHLLTSVASTLVLFYLFLAAAASLTREFPVIPLGIAMLHLPIAVVFVRGILARAYDPTKVYSIISSTCTLIAGLLLIWCTLSMSMKGNRWNPETRAVLRRSLEEFGQDFVNDGQACAVEPADSGSVDTCSKLDLVAFLIFTAPLAQSALFLAFAFFSALRAWILSKHALCQLSIIMRIAVGLANLIVVSFWIATSVSGINREMSLAILFIAGISCICFLVWVYFSIAMSDLIACAMDEPLVAAFAPLCSCDEFKGCVLSVALFIVVPFLLVEAAVQRCQRMLKIAGSHSYLTPSALKILREVEGWVWTRVLEQAFWWDLFCVLAWVCCSQLTVVFMAGVRDALDGANFVKFCCLFFVSVLAFFTAIPIPGIPSYFCFGSVIVRRACKEQHFDFKSGVILACVLCWLLKFMAVSVQLTLGSFLGRSVRVQGALGIQRSWVRAVRGILTGKGITLDKVFIICGGPDWPTAVLAGVFQLPLCNTLLCLLPSTAVILPCVFAGALFGEASWSTASRLLIAVMTLLQGLLLFRACYAVLHRMQDHSEELRFHRQPSMEALFEHVQQQLEITKLTSLCSEWDALSLPCKLLLSTATLAEMSCCWILFFLSALCFRDFDILSDLRAPLHDGGLDGKPWNMVTPFGACTLGLSVVGTLLMAAYYASMHWNLQQVLSSASRLREWQSAVAHMQGAAHSCLSSVDGPLPRQPLSVKGTPPIPEILSLGGQLVVARKG